VLGSFVGVVRWRILPAIEGRQRQMAAIAQSASDLPLPADEWLAEDNAGRANNTTQAPLEAGSAVPTPLSDAAVTDRELVLPANRSAQVKSAARSTSDPAAPAAAPEVTAPPELVVQLDSLLREACAALRERRWDDADRTLQRAQSLASSTTQAPRVERFVTLWDYARQYYQAYEDGLQDLAGSELTLRDQPVIVVEVTAGEIVIRMQGVNRRFPRNGPPTELMMLIADRWFNQRAATTQIFRGAFMLVTPPFTADDVRTIWQSAERSGAPLGDLLEILPDLEALQLAPAKL
jgi:hypothetical protein